MGVRKPRVVLGYSQRQFGPQGTFSNVWGPLWLAVLGRLLLASSGQRPGIPEWQVHSHLQQSCSRSTSSAGISHLVCRVPGGPDSTESSGCSRSERGFRHGVCRRVTVNERPIGEARVTGWRWRDGHWLLKGHSYAGGTLSWCILCSGCQDGHRGPVAEYWSVAPRERGPHRKTGKRFCL